MKTLAIDIETYSSVSLQKCGVYAYAQSPDFEILLFGYAWDDGPVEVIDLAICDCCKDCIREFGLYRWDEKAIDDRPLKTDDHAMDDTRYFVRAAFQPSRFSF